jgi:hypothetical protein
MELFGAHCSLLQVPPEELPGLQPLLQLLQPPLRSLSSSLQRAVTLEDTEAEAQPDAQLTSLLQETVKLAARYVYTKQPQHYLQLLTNGQLQQLVDMQAYSALALVETLSLTAADGAVIHTEQQSAGALVCDVAASEDSITSDDEGTEAAPAIKAMLVNTSLALGSQHRSIANNLADLLCSSSSNSSWDRSSAAMLEPLSQLIKLLLMRISSGEPEEVEKELEDKGAGQLPRDKRLWRLPGEEETAAAAADSGVSGSALSSKQIWVDDDSDDAEGIADTGDSAEHRAQRLAAAQARSRSAAEQQERASSAEQQESQGLELANAAAATTADTAEVHTPSSLTAGAARGHVMLRLTAVLLRSYHNR